jgi:hypothetical protein
MRVVDGRRWWSRFILSLLLLVIPLTPSTAAMSSQQQIQLAQSETQASTRFKVDLQSWFLNGELSWRKYWGVTVSPILLPIIGFSELKFPIQSTLPRLTLNWSPEGSRLGGAFWFATGGINRGSSSDSEWLTYDLIHNTAISPLLIYQTQQPSFGAISAFGVDGTYLLRATDRSTLTALVGWQGWTYNFRMVDPITPTACDPAWWSCPPGWNTPTSPGLDSTYDITYSGVHFGLRGDYRVSSNATLFGSISYSPITARGTGYWNLRNLTFNHNGNGTATVVEVGIGWTPRDRWAVNLGYTLAAFTSTGRETFACVRPSPPGFCGDLGLGWESAATNQGFTLAVTYRW